jgi:hypothetical protein
LSARDAAIAVQKQDAAGISAQIRRVGRRLFEALDYLDNDRSAALFAALRSQLILLRQVRFGVGRRAAV